MLRLAICRYYSLCSYMGDDDMFSSDLSDDQLRMRLGHMANTPCQVCMHTTLFLVYLSGAMLLKPYLKT